MTDPVFDNLIQALSTEAAGEALSALCPLAKTKAGREQIEAALGDHALLHTLLLQESPKVRKNTYRLLGALQNPVDAALLCRALETETTLFAVPSLLLALGALGQKDALFGYTVPASTGPEIGRARV